MVPEERFKEIVAQYCDIKPEDMRDDLRFREDMGFSSLDFMSLLGELEDEFDVELEEDKVVKIQTIKEAMDLIGELKEEM